GRLAGRFVEAAELAEQLLGLVDAGIFAPRTGQRIRARALALLGIAELWLGRERAQSRLHEALDLARAADVTAAEVSSLGCLALIELGAGRLRPCLTLAPSAIGISEGRGLAQTPQAGVGYAALVVAEYEWNDLAAAEAHARRLATLAAASGDRVARALSACFDGCICLARGDGGIELGVQRLSGAEHD